MDKEAREKIGGIFCLYYEERQKWNGLGSTPEDVGIKRLQELGYRKSPDRPKLRKKLKEWFWKLSVGQLKAPSNLSSDELAGWRADQILALIPDIPNEYRRCPKCSSIWVCWNWVHAWGGDRKKYKEMNPHISPKELLDWGHECWDCENCFETKEKVTDGLPYEFLKTQYRPKLPKDKPPRSAL